VLTSKRRWEKHHRPATGNPLSFGMAFASSRNSQRKMIAKQVEDYPMPALPLSSERMKARCDEGWTITSRECREEADRFAALSLAGGISVRRATILMAIADSWSRLAGQLDRLVALERDEKP
jgi:hypothetical protein